MDPQGISRRAFVGSGALGVLGLLPAGRVAELIDEVAGGRLPSGGGRFLSGAELATLRAATARLVPSAPDGPGPGALDVHAAEAIDLLLGAFALHPPLIHAGGPFSGRDGGNRDDFARFVPLDAQTELGWRIRLEGSRGLREREFAGPVVGLQEVYGAGLARLDQLARADAHVAFTAASTSVQDTVLAAHDPLVERFVTATMTNTLEALCGPPEYGGNHGLAGWSGLGWLGDRQPGGFTAAQVTAPDPPGGLAGRAASEERAAVLARVAPLLARGRRGAAR